MNVTLLISFNVVRPNRTRCNADSRRNDIPSARAAFRTSELGLFSRIISRILSFSSRSSWIAVRPLYPVPPHSIHPAPSLKSNPDHSAVSSPLSCKVSRSYWTDLLQSSQMTRTKSLGENAVQRGNEVIRFDTHVEKTPQDVDHVVGVDSGEDKVTRQC